MIKKITLFLILIFSLTIVKAADIDTIFKETEFAYYRTSIYSQYNSAKNSYYDPAEATAQDRKYSVCSRYTANVYQNAFDITIPGNTNALMKFVDANYKKSKYRKYIIDYHDCVTNAKGKGTCTTMTESAYNSLISKLKPGDILVSTKGDIGKGGSGHALIVYDLFTNSSGKKDAYILNSTGGSRVYTRTLGTNNIYFNYRKVSDPEISSNIHKSISEGTVKMTRFRNDARLAFTSKSQAYGVDGNKKYRVAIIRFIVNNKYPVFDSSYNITGEKPLTISKSNGYLRTKYKDLSISKTVDAIDNSVVTLNQELVYTLKIKNNSSSAYGKFYVQENVSTGKYVSIVSAEGGTISGNKINYEIPSLAAGATKTLTYKVKVTDNVVYLNNTIVVSGKISNTSNFALSLTTGTIKNKIDNKLTDENKAQLKESYNNLKASKKGLELINETYKTALNIDLDLTNFKISSLIKENKDIVNACKARGLLGRNCSDAMSLTNYKIGSTNYTYKDMILSNYWNGLVNQDTTLNDDNIDFNSSKPQKAKNLYRWAGSGDSAKRAKTIMPNHFQDGDILIYYNSNDFEESDSSQKRNSYEDGLYAYIYLNGSFIGVNYSGDKARSYFTTKYYTKDHTDVTWYSSQSASNIPTGAAGFTQYQSLFGKYYYVILRPALAEEMVGGVTAQFEIEAEETVRDPIPENEDPGEDEGPSESELPTDLDNTPENLSNYIDEDNASSPIENPNTGATISFIIIILGFIIAIIFNKAYQKGKIHKI